MTTTTSKGPDQARRSGPGRILGLIGLSRDMSLMESAILLRIVWAYADGKPAVMDDLVTLESPVSVVEPILQSLRARDVISIQGDGTIVPKRFAEWCASEQRRLEALAEYNAHRVSRKVSAIDNLSVEIVQQFNEFWKRYPRVPGRAWSKVAALQAFSRAIRVARLEEILAGLEIAKRSRQWQEEGGRFIPMPSTFLNQRRWEDFISEREHVLADVRMDAPKYQGKTIKIGSRVYSAANPPQRSDFDTEQEYIKARSQWAVWLAQL
jgi:hypothetical protein